MEFEYPENVRLLAHGQALSQHLSSSCYLNSCVRAVVEQVLKGSERAVRIDLCLCNDEIASVRCSEEVVIRVVKSLLMNSLKSLLSGGDIRVTTRKVILDGRSMVLLRVTDNGVGISDIEKNKMFYPTFSTHPHGTETEMSIAEVLRIVSRSGGSLQVDSEPGHGATCSVFLPAFQRSPVQNRHPQHDFSDFSLERVWIVEDEAILQRVLGRVFEVAGANVSLFSSAEEALLQLKEISVLPDLLITDVSLFGMTGLDFAALIQDRWPSLKVIVMSGYDLTPSTTFPLLQKPFTLQELYATLKSVFA